MLVLLHSPLTPDLPNVLFAKRIQKNQKTQKNSKRSSKDDSRWDHIKWNDRFCREHSRRTVTEDSHQPKFLFDSNARVAEPKNLEKWLHPPERNRFLVFHGWSYWTVFVNQDPTDSSKQSVVIRSDYFDYRCTQTNIFWNTTEILFELLAFPSLILLSANGSCILQSMIYFSVLYPKKTKNS